MKEVEYIKKNIFYSLKQFDFYTYLTIDEKDFGLIKPKKFSARFINNNNKLKLVYKFIIPVDKPIKNAVTICFKDKTIYCAFDLVKKNISCVIGDEFTPEISEFEIEYIPAVKIKF